MKSFKRFMASALVLSLLLACMTACGGGGDKSTPGASSSNPGGGSGTPAAEPVVLKFATEMASGTPEVKAAEIC